MTPNIIKILFILFFLAGCSATGNPAQPSPQPPAATFPPVPTRVVTLSESTPLPRTPTPSLVMTEPTGPLVTLHGDDFVNLRGGPSALDPIVGRAANGATFVALARSQYGEWLLLSFPDAPGGTAWVYAAYTDYQPAVHPLPVAAGGVPGAAVQATAQGQVTLTPVLMGNGVPSSVIDNVRAGLDLPMLPLTYVETTNMINSPTGGLKVMIYQDTQGRKYSLDPVSNRVVEIDARTLLPGIPTAAPSLTEEELQAKAQKMIQAVVPNFASLESSLQYEAGGKGELYFYTWRGPITPGSVNPPFVQIGLHKSGLLFAYYNTLQPDK